MKKVLFLLVALFTLTLSAQTYTHNSKVRVKATAAAAPTDNIVSIDANGELKRTSQTVSDIGGDLSNYVDKTSDENVGGSKNFTDPITIVGSLVLENRSNVASPIGGNISYKTNAFQFTNRVGDVGDVFALKFDNLTASRIYDLPNKSGTFALTSDLTGAQNLQSVTTEGSVTSLGIETGSYTTQSGTHLVELYPTSLAMYEYAGNKYTEVSPSNMSVSNATGSTSVQASGVTILEGGSPKAELTKDDLRFYKGVNSGS